MAIRVRGGSDEFAFILFRGEGRVDAMNLRTGITHENVPLREFVAGGGVNEIVREIKMIPHINSGKGGRS